MPKYERAARLVKLSEIGVDRMGNAADAALDPEMLRLENMDTDLPPPAIALEATRKSIGVDANNSYLPLLGQDAMRQAATLHVNNMSGQSYDWRSQCVISAGGLSGILSTLLALLNPGDEVILTDPTYAGLINRVLIAGGVVKFVPLIPSIKGWYLDIKALKEAASPRTRILLMASPSLPTGHVMSAQEWQVVCDVCKQTDAWLLYDAAMERILFDRRQVLHPASFPGMAERTITVGSATKELRMIGWRVGWIIGPTAIMNDIAVVSIANVCCQVGISMPGVTVALTEGNDISFAVQEWEERRNLMLQELHDLPVIPPHGGWAMLIDTLSLGTKPEEASERLFKVAKIAALPMTGWGGEIATRYLRFVFANEPKERLKGMGAKIRKALCYNRS